MRIAGTRLLTLAVVAAALSVGCTTEKIVYRSGSNFVAPPGSCIASADYSQIELRIMAHISQDPALLRAFHEGVDVHRATAAEVFGVGADQVSNQCIG